MLGFITGRHVCLELVFHRDFWGHLVLPQSSHMRLSDHVYPEHPRCVFPAPPLFSWPLTQDLSLCFVVQVRVPALAPCGAARSHFGMKMHRCRYGVFRCTPRWCWPALIPLAGLGSGLGPSRLPAQVTEVPNISKMRLQTGMKRSVWCSPELSCVFMVLCL